MEKKVSVANVKKLPRRLCGFPVRSKATAKEEDYPAEGEMIIYESCLGPDASRWGWILGEVQSVDSTEGRVTVWCWGTPYVSPKTRIRPAWFSPDKLNTKDYERHSDSDLTARGYEKWIDDTVSLERIWIRDIQLINGKIRAQDVTKARRMVKIFDANTTATPKTQTAGDDGK